MDGEHAITEMNDNNYIIASEVGIRIDALTDISLALEKCLGKAGLLLTEQDCGTSFFDLKTRVAGELFQKFINYHIAIALVIPDSTCYSERFTELAREHANHSQIRFVYSEQAAREFLTGK